MAGSGRKLFDCYKHLAQQILKFRNYCAAKSGSKLVGYSVKRIVQTRKQKILLQSQKYILRLLKIINFCDMIKKYLKAKDREV